APDDGRRACRLERRAAQRAARARGVRRVRVEGGPMTARFDRRRLLFGAGGSLLAIPLLESLAPRSAYAAPVAPKRLVVVRHNAGRMVGGAVDDPTMIPDVWAPAKVTGPLPQGMSPLLAPLDPIRQEVVTLDGIDNIVRLLGNTDGHTYPLLTSLTCV